MYKSETILSLFFFLLLARLSSFSRFFSSFLLSFFIFFPLWRRGDKVTFAEVCVGGGNDAITAQLTQRFLYPRICGCAYRGEDLNTHQGGGGHFLLLYYLLYNIIFIVFFFAKKEEKFDDEI